MEVSSWRKKCDIFEREHFLFYLPLIFFPMIVREKIIQVREQYFWEKTPKNRHLKIPSSMNTSIVILSLD